MEPMVGSAHRGSSMGLNAEEQQQQKVLIE